jgi:Domain of unknown function (DU1801)
MADNKTKPTPASVAAHIAATATDAQRADAEVLVALMRGLTGEDPVMWGPSIIGFGAYHYRYASGHEADAALLGFALRKTEFTLYVPAGFEGQELLLAQLGRHKASKACLYVKRLADIDLKVLEQLCAASIADIRRRYPSGG